MIRHQGTIVPWAWVASLALSMPAVAQPALPPTEAPSPAPAHSNVDVSGLDAAAAVRAGNRRLKSDDPAAALQAYEYAHSQEPDAREIDFVKGLAHFKRGEYALARESFENAATAESDALVDDALYSVGTTYHAEALAREQNPQQALPLLEQAMQQYQKVLDHTPEHEAAQDANYRAASKWRVIKKLLEQQQQQQQQSQNQDQNQDQDQDQEKNEDRRQQQQQSDQQNQEQQEQQHSQPQDQQQQSESEKQQESQQQSEQQDQQEPQEQQSQSDERELSEKQLQAQQAEQEEVSREDAERKLRQFMQALRERSEHQPRQRQQYRPAPVEKDW